MDAAGAQGLIPNLIAGRIANKLDLMGPAYTVDAACASSLLALEHAVQGLQRGAFQLALVGGSYVVSPAAMAHVFDHLRVLSPSGAIRPFSADSDGTLLGEGIGMIVLKPLAAALRDGNPVYAVVKGVGIASDGSGRTVIAPRHEGALLAMQRAYHAARVAPQTIGLLEAHGLGTTVGDSVEFNALAAIFGARHTAEPTIPLGTVKPMTGHLMPASGIAGLIKAALALHHRILPPTLNAEHPNPELSWGEAPFYLNTETRPWQHTGREPRRAGVNSFGFGGVAAHAILEEAPAAAVRPAVAPLTYLSEPDRIILKTRHPILSLAAQDAYELSQELAPTHVPGGTPPSAPFNPPLPAPLHNDQSTTQEEEVMTTPTPMHPLAPAMMAAYTDMMKTFLTVQRDVMLAALGSSAGSAPVALPSNASAYPAPPPEIAPALVYSTLPTAPSPAAVSNGYHRPTAAPTATATQPFAAPAEVAAPAAAVVPAQTAQPQQTAAPAATQESLSDRLRELVAERTGYPAAMIDPDLDLEADLGIDSIKRVEILTAFQQQAGAAAANVNMDDLIEQKTLRHIAELISAAV
jgi:acyl carrier protein